MNFWRPYPDIVLGRDTLDLPVALLASVAAAVLAFAVPEVRLAELAGGVGFDRLVPASFTRVVLGAGGFLVVFLLVIGLLRRIDEADARAGGALAVRRRDLHPDAPPRRPLSAALELGEPEMSEVPAGGLPLWLCRADFRQDCGFVPSAGEGASEASPAPSARDHESLWDERDQARRQTIFELMGKLEKGLGGALSDGGSGLTGTTEAASAPKPAGEDFLQGAIDSLQRLAARRA